MRVIAGTHRGRTLLGPQDDQVTRPITDRVKQSLFDRLWSLGALDAQAALDIFAGTGSLGIEALSRGVPHCTFIERDRSARSILEKNLATLDLTHRATVLAVDALATGWLALLSGEPVSLIFCDPPYAMTQDEQATPRVRALIESLATVTSTTPTPGILTLRTDSHTQPPTAHAWHPPASHTYGSMTVHLYERDEADQRG